MKKETLWVLVVVWDIACLWGSRGCWEQERIALLALNETLDLPYYGADTGGSISNCCSWYGVECNPTTGRVTQLRLYGLRASRFGIKTWYLNASLLLPFEELKSLDLSFIDLGGWIAPEEPNLLYSRLRKLEVLYLSSNSLDNSILPILDPNLLSSRLRKLEVLDLIGNSLDNSILPILGTIPSLRRIYLQGNNLNGTLQMNDPNLLFSRLSKLEVLDLSYNYLDNSILPILGTIPSLRRIYLRRNNLSGTLHMNGGFSNLMELDISDNAIDAATTAEGIKNLSRLENLHLDYVHLKDAGTVLRALGALSSLRILSLQDNTVEGTITAQDFHNFSKLEQLFLDYSSLNTSMGILSSLGPATSLRLLSSSSTGLIGNLSNQSKF
ncbi:hypothetical protein NL676_033108 [Syzygium grande]|nr:hypothetical protein NL676_033108 [Syzygium grande]